MRGMPLTLGVCRRRASGGRMALLLGGDITIVAGRLVYLERTTDNDSVCQQSSVGSVEIL